MREWVPGNALCIITPGADHLNKMIRKKCTMIPRNVPQVKIGCRIFAQIHPSTVALAPECNHMKFTGNVEKRNSDVMQGRCTAICISADHGQELAEWVAAVHEQVLEVKVKMRRFREKEMMGRRVGGQSRARLWTYILFSQGPLLYLLFHAPPICCFTADCTFWGANCLLTDYLLHSE